jgi:hypothetical protein
LEQKGLLNGEEISHALRAYKLICRECKADYMPCTYEKVQKALRVSKLSFVDSGVADE